MRTEHMNNLNNHIRQSSWPKVVMKKWLNIKSSADEFHSDYTIPDMADKGQRRSSCSDGDQYDFVPQDFSEGLLMEASDGLNGGPRFEAEEAPSAINDGPNLRTFVGTWNVGGKSPHKGLNLRDWLKSPAPADIYVLGFQEIVPLNAGNVLGAEDNGPAAKWLSLIRQALNGNKIDPEFSQYYSNATAGELKRSSPPPHHHHEKHRLSFSDLLSLEDELEQGDFERFYRLNSNSSEECSPNPSPPCVSMRHQQASSSPMRRKKYCLAASKQMVGIFLCVWVRADLNRHISNLKVSCVGRGIMGYLGNKGSISISMTLHQTSFCFVCTHLTSGEKEGDEVRRNSDVMEILKKTRFFHSHRVPGQPLPPDNILDHDNVVWLGDLNYRLASRSGETNELLEKNDWQALLEKDQLKIEQRAGRVFKGWEEGSICFAPTYKYLTNSDHYVVQTTNSKEKQRTPAWCDRILWRGEGLKQKWYVRGESKFSDHRPVYSLFSVQVGPANDKINRLPNTYRAAAKKHSTRPKTKTLLTNNTGLSSTACFAKVQAEELLLVTRAQSCIETTPRF